MTATLFVWAALAVGQLPTPVPGLAADFIGGSIADAAAPPAVAPDALPLTVEAPLLTPPKPAEPAAETPAAASSPDRWLLMRELQGTWAGAALDDNRMSVSGWVTGSYNASSAAQNNAPVVWNDRANEFLMQQAWLRISRSVVTSGTTEPTFGFQADFLYGSDYRFTLPRGLFNSQLQNADGGMNLYGIDPIQHYLAAYVPTLFKGTEFRVGRLYTPWGVESLESISTPMISRSYAFNFSPPFTHCGAGAYVTFSPQWSAVFMAANGNDVYFGDPSEEWRFVGNVKWTQPGGRNTVTLATSVGRGKFNRGEPYFAPTVALPVEPAGRNNINVFDVVWTHQIDPKLSYNFEAIYGYQRDVPNLPTPAGAGTARWFSAAHYLFATLTPQVGANLRVETFWDFQGQRTGFEGMYTAVSGLIRYQPRKDVILRAEVRYDYNNETRPFEGDPALLSVAADLTLRF